MRIDWLREPLFLVDLDAKDGDDGEHVVLGHLIASHPKGGGREMVIAHVLHPKGTHRSEVSDLMVCAFGSPSKSEVDPELGQRAIDMFSETMRRATGKEAYQPTAAAMAGVIAVVGFVQDTMKRGGKHAS